MRGEERITDWRTWRRLWPAPPNRASHTEKWISAAGGFLGIIALLEISGAVLDQKGAALVVASMGATAVLLFAVPRGTLSQPWPVLGGHVVSALVGVTCAQQIGDPVIAAASAVGLAIAAMYYLHCIHPPGGATAMVAVLGGEGVHQLGYAFVISPVLINAVILLVIGMAVSLPFRSRRYPAERAQGAESTTAPPGEKTMIAHSDLVYALSQLDSFIDVSEHDLIRIYTLAVHHSRDPVPCHLNGRECGSGSDDCVCRRLAAGGDPDFGQLHGRQAMIAHHQQRVPETDTEGYLVSPETWDEAVAEQLAEEEGIELTEEHWRIFGFMRRYYEEHQIIPDSRFVIKFMAEELGHGRAARNDLFKLFPYGYVKQACKIAGMKRPRAWSTG